MPSAVTSMLKPGSAAHKTRNDPATRFVMAQECEGADSEVNTELTSQQLAAWVKALLGECRTHDRVVAPRSITEVAELAKFFGEVAKTAALLPQ